MLPKLNLVVLRSADIDRAAKFYGQLGFVFEKHSHGKGPEHYASEVNGMVLEIYPATEKFPATVATRIGFAVGAVNQAVSLLRNAGAQVLTEPCDSEWGRRAVVKDLDGHTVELVAIGIRDIC
jgi:lactoylglutathione lyase